MAGKKTIPTKPASVIEEKASEDEQQNSNINSLVPDDSSTNQTPDTDHEDELLDDDVIDEIAKAPSSKSTSCEPSALPPVMFTQIPVMSEALIHQLMEQLVAARSELKPEALSEEEKSFAALNKAFKTTTPTSVYHEAEKLQGRQNYTTWLETIMIDLRGYSLSGFIEAPMAEGIIEISPMRRVALDAQTLQFIRLSLAKSAAFTVADAKTAYEAMELIKKHHGNDKQYDLIDIDTKWSKLKLWPNYDRNRFTYEFNQLVKRFLRARSSTS